MIIGNQMDYKLLKLRDKNDNNKQFGTSTYCT